MQRLLLCCLLVACSRPLEGTLLEGRIHSDALDTDYALNTYIRDDAPLGPGAPWVLVLDGDIVSEWAAEALDDEVRAGRAAPVVLVAIANRDTRDRDYCAAPRTFESDRLAAEAWFEFLDDTVVPQVEEELGVGGSREDRAIMGHSYGGLATLFAMRYHRDTWGGFGAMSPSLWYDEAVAFVWEEELAAEAPDLTGPVYLAMGSHEPTGMDAYFTAYAERVEEDLPHLDLTSEVIQNRNHYTVVPKSLRHALSALHPEGE